MDPLVVQVAHSKHEKLIPDQSSIVRRTQVWSELAPPVGHETRRVAESCEPPRIGDTSIRCTPRMAVSPERLFTHRGVDGVHCEASVCQHFGRVALLLAPWIRVILEMPPVHKGMSIVQHRGTRK